MIKHSIRLTSFLLGIFTFLIILQHTMIEQQKLPFDTMEQFELNIPNSKEYIDSLNELTSRNDGILVKVATDSETYEDKKDIKIMAS